jgi:uncharacterized protein
MGGGVAIRVMTVRPAWVKAVVLYSSMSANAKENATQIYNVFSNRSRELYELRTPENWLMEISPLHFLNRVSAAISVHHSTSDEQVPYA